MQNVIRSKYYYEYEFKFKKSYLTMCKNNKRDNFKLKKAVKSYEDYMIQ